MNGVIKRFAWGFPGATIGAITAQMAMVIIGSVHTAVIIVIAVLCSIAAFFGGRPVIEYIFKMDDDL